MNQIFLEVINLSITASLVAVVVLLLRLVFKKAPKWISAALWVFVGLRLIMPFSLESNLSVLPHVDISSAPKVSSDVIVHSPTGSINYVLDNSLTSSQSVNHNLSALDVFAVLWAVGVVAFLLYGIISYLAVYKKVRTAIPLMGNIYQSENVKSPFVLGFIKPRIVVPFNLESETLHNVILHENAHLKRKDHLVKPFAYLLLCMHWFNPLMWLSYILLCRDIEVACDEKVIKTLSFAERKTYAMALLECKVKNTTVAVCPVAFGEVSVKARIKNTLSYKKPGLWVVILAISASIIASGCLLTNPKAETATIEENPAVEEATIPMTEPFEETVPSTVLPTQKETEIKTEPTTQEITEVYTYEEEYYEEDYITDTEVPFTLRSINDVVKEYADQQFEESLQEYYSRLKSETSNHTDDCQCPSCKRLRDAGIYPPLYNIEPPEVPAESENTYETVNVLPTGTLEFIEP